MELLSPSIVRRSPVLAYQCVWAIITYMYKPPHTNQMDTGIHVDPFRHNVKVGLRPTSPSTSLGANSCDKFLCAHYLYCSNHSSDSPPFLLCITLKTLPLSTPLHTIPTSTHPNSYKHMQVIVVTATTFM